jgi:hypothetical protein
LRPGGNLRWIVPVQREMSLRACGTADEMLDLIDNLSEHK